MPRTLVSEIMTPNPVSIEHDQTIGRAMEMMARYDIRRLPVTKGGKLAGILSDRDVRQLGGRYSVKLPRSDADDAYLQLLVEEAMTLSVITVRESQPLDEAVRLMIKNKISGMPVVDHDKKMVGMLSEQDILKLCLGLLEREADR